MNASESPLELAIASARVAARLCRKVQAGIPASMDKDDRSPVTLADYGSQAIILRAVQESFPDHRVMSEEGTAHLRSNADPAQVEQLVSLVSDAIGGETEFEQVCDWIDHSGTNSAWAWCIDPIDGTKGFLRGDQYAIAIGILREGVPFAGVLACPNLPVDLDDPESPRGVIFAALRGEGAKRCPLDEEGWKTVRVSDRSAADARVLGSVESAHGDPALVVRMMEDAGMEGGFVRFDSQVKYGVLAQGDAEIYVRPRSRPDWRENPWDHAGGVVVAEEAGGRVTDLDGKALDFSSGGKMVHNRGVLATNGIVHEAAVAGLQAAEAI
jgi:3'(2'), 5'-bisphosphate nucleotidase